ncbi:MAG: DUF4864 domain-containing protein [Pseudomonadota bacterium]
MSLLRLAPAWLLALVMIAAQPATAEDPGTSIRTVIQDQLSAFQDNDVATAFGFAAPSIQQKFGSPEDFGQMVKQGYPMVWRPRSHQMGRLLETAAGLVQLVVFEDGNGRLYEAGYLMEQIDGAWRIAGVHLRAMPGAGA